MSNLEIVQKSNEFKREYNDNKEHVDKNNQVLTVLNQFKAYFEFKQQKINIEKKRILGFSIALLPISILLFIISLPAAIISSVFSIIGFSRYHFLNYVNKRFVKCLEFFEINISNTAEKQNNYLQKQEYIKSQIIDLENQISDEIISPLTKLNSELNEQDTNIELSI